MTTDQELLQSPAFTDLQTFVSAQKTPTLDLEESTQQVWIDGRTIFRKWIDCGNLPNNTTKQIPHGLKVAHGISMTGFAYVPSTGVTLNLPHVDTVAGFGVKVVLLATTLDLATTTDLSAYRGYVQIKYLKE